MDKRFVIFAVPSLDHRVTLDFLRSWTSTLSILHQHDIPVGVIVRGGDCFVAKVRNKLVKQFLDTGGTDLFFLDDDLGWDASKAVEFIMRDEPIVAGVYPKKDDTPDWPVSFNADAETGELVEDQGLISAGFVGGGFMRIRRDVLEELVKHVPTFLDVEMGGTCEEYPLLFNAGLDADGWWCGEDVAFCRLAAAHGFPVWVDPDIMFRHRGGKTWSGRLGDAIPQFRDRARTMVRGMKAA